MEKVHEVGPLRVTVEAPDAAEAELRRLVEAGPIIVCEVRSQEEFEASVEALGGPAVFEFEHAWGEVWQARTEADGLRLMIRVRAGDPSAPPAPPLIARMRAAQLEVAKADADAALERPA